MHATHESTEVPAWPVYALAVHGDGRVVVSGPLMPAVGHPTRASAVGTVSAAAARLGRPVRAEATEPDGTVWYLAISPDGAVGELPGGGQRTRAQGRRENRSPAPPEETAGEPARAGGRSVPGTGPDPGTGTGTGAGTETGPDAYAGSLALVTEHLEAGRLDRAAELAARLDEQAAGALGVSHPDALGIREVRARVAVLAGDTDGGVRLFRDVAERWHYRGDGERAEAAAARAETAWMQITDLDTALSSGVAMVRLRNQIPGEDEAALTTVLEHQAWLAAARAADGPPSRAHPAAVVPRGVPAADRPGSRSAGTRGRPPMPSWERPAQDTEVAR
ncbi:hypothetical protein V1L54_16490 [Streptomyces sp. TRM 70361]|uniref:hypothetical protein n=1 Tax=Streptomyces sp. TRM 70361 TaxID=3116553 RepID=UPI002E7BD470|nr:hypothetical protein [Streptomyces sp. TRM 70361]MEE1940983.1 hypothetical protein [Streptomyces sp. TRM 70361]